MEIFVIQSKYGTMIIVDVYYKNQLIGVLAGILAVES